MYLGRYADLPGYLGEDRETWPPSIQQRWARDEFDRLRIAVQAYGPANIELLTKFVATKSPEEVVKMLPLFLSNLPPQPTAPASQTPTYRTTGFGWQTTHVPGPTQPHMTTYDANTVPHPAGLSSGSPTVSSNSTSPAPRSSALSSAAHPQQRHAQPASTSLHMSHQHSAPSSNNLPYAHSATSYDVGNHTGAPNHDSSMFQSDASFRQIPHTHTSFSAGAHTSSSLSSRPSSGALPRADTPIPPPNNGHATEFINYQAFNAPPPAGAAHPIATHSTPSYVMSNPSSGQNSSYQVFAPAPPPQHHTQPTISISVYESDHGSMNSSSSRSVYVPAPGQAFVNMDKTTLFTPSNPPRPGSPRSPRTPKSPKSPKSPGSSAPHTPK